MYIKILILFLAIKTQNQSCTPGCLQCSESRTCSLCDPFNSYYLDNFTCIKKNINCEQLTSKTSCKLCPPKHYFDPNIPQCLEITPLNQIPNCLRYSNLLSCAQCLEGFYLKEGKCEIPEVGIENCRFYKNPEECAECEYGYVPAIDSRKCVFAFSGNNCLFFDFVECGECFSGYKKNENKYVDDFFGGQGEQRDWGVMERVFLKSWGKIDVNVCSKVVVENCKEFSHFDKCFVCNEGYFRDSNFRCQQNPLPKFLNCLKYSNENTCEECEAGFYLETDRNCKANDVIQGCSYYSGTLYNQTRCLECEYTSYLFQNTCVERKNDIANCEELEPNLDQCKKCGFEKITSSDGLKCYEKILNCKQYITSTKSDDQLTCKICQEGYYYHETLKKCEKGTITNCNHYFQNLDKCSTCQTKYFLENEKCVEHSNFENCDIYDPSLKNECSYCKKGFVIIKHTNGCVRVENIKQGCILYKNANECSECEKGYFLTNQNTCDLVPLSSNCEIYTLLGCQKCKEDYILENSECFLPISIFVDNCLQKSINGSHSFETAKCDICSKGSFPYNLKGQFYCLENWRRINIKNENILNCLRYSFEGNQMVCKECLVNFWLQDSGICIEKENCSLAYLPFKKYSLNNKIEKKNLCTNISTGCILGALNNKNMNTVECAKCNSLTHLQKIKNFEDSDNFIPYNNFVLTSLISPALSPVSYYPRIECLLNNDSSLINSTIINNCELYGDIGNDKIGCLKCKNGFSGLLENSSDIGYIKSCVDMDSCEDKENFGIPRDIKLLSSCTACKTPSEIPFIFVNADPFFHKIKGLLAYNTNFEKTTQGGLSNKCLQKTTTALNLTSLNLPSHCSLAIYNINSIKDASESNKTIGIDKTKIATFCVSCEPAWRPLKGIDSTGLQINYYVGQCEEISNCKFSDWFNNCSECNNGYVYQFISGKGVMYDQCINYDKDFFCLAIDNSNPVSPVCKVCKKGYFLNLDNICENITFSKCENFEPMLKMELDLYRTWNYMFYEIEGCNECSIGFDLFLKLPNEDFNVCYLSEYTNKEINYIANCIDYYANLETIKCYNCKDGYTKDRYETECINQEKSNCLKLDKNTFKCIECNEESVIADGICEIKKKANCENYSTAESNNEQICIKCKEGYFLKNNNCEKGKIDNCADFTEDGSDCLNCKENFIKGKTIEGKNYCILINLDFDCGKFNNINIDQLTCSACNKDYYLTNDSTLFRKSSCLEINMILNCKEYDIGEKFNKSSFKCLDCDLNYYLEDNLCKKRILSDTNCIEYSKNSDKCYTCKEKHFVSSTGNCRLNPTGIDNCIEYINNTTCKTCSNTTYLKNNTCIEVQTKIENCEQYENELTCRKCIPNHIILNQKCEKSEALNCLTYINSKNCETCPEKFGFKLEGGIKSCVFKSHVTNCKKSENEYPFICLECFNQTILSDKKQCVPPLEKIQNCEEYVKEGICLKCSALAILNENGTSCTLVKNFGYNVDKNCKVNFKLKNPVCRICEKGYYLFLGECLKCNVYNCAVCDVESEGNKCIMCDLEYYMDEDKKCVFKDDGEKIEFVNFGGFLKIFGVLMMFLIYK